jgi:hypothetical protein
MAKKTITIQLSEEQVADLQGAFESLTEAKPPNLSADQFQSIAQLAAESWIDLVAGRNRYRSLTEQYLNWLDKIYAHVLTDEEPSERRLYTRLHFPYGQAQYLARILREQHLGSWRKRSLHQLRAELEAKRTDAKKFVKDGRGEEQVALNISKGSKVELDNILGTLVERRVQGISPVKTVGSMGSSVAVLIVASNIEPVIQEIDQLLGAK